MGGSALTRPAPLQVAAAARATYGFVVLLHIRYPSGLYQCGATLLSSTAVLTAAHASLLRSAWRPFPPHALPQCVAADPYAPYAPATAVTALLGFVNGARLWRGGGGP